MFRPKTQLIFQRGPQHGTDIVHTHTHSLALTLSLSWLPILRVYSPSSSVLRKQTRVLRAHLLLADDDVRFDFGLRFGHLGLLFLFCFGSPHRFSHPPGDVGVRVVKRESITFLCSFRNYSGSWVHEFEPRAKQVLCYTHSPTLVLNGVRTHTVNFVQTGAVSSTTVREKLLVVVK